MANFVPLKKYIFYCLNQLIETYDLEPEFLDIGCGIGDVSKFLGEKGWRGRAIDLSEEALEKAKQNLSAFPSISLEKKDFFGAKGTYKTVFLLDILEHIPEDEKALQKLASLVSEKGYAVIAVPSNPRFWKWDDDFYGHVRRYTPKGIKKKLEDAGLETVAIWDFTFPVFWMMRLVYVKMKSNSEGFEVSSSPEERTLRSGVAPKWQNSFWVDLIGKLSFVWDWIYWFQFTFFKNKPRWGHEMIVLAKKTEMVTTHG